MKAQKEIFFTDSSEYYLKKILKRNSALSDYSEELVSYIKDWPTYYHLAPGRSNILRALNLPTNLSILEIGCGCGAITRYLGETFSHVVGIEIDPVRAKIAKERCKDLKNVDIHCNDIRDIKNSSLFDVVILIGVVEYAPKFFPEESKINSCIKLLSFAQKYVKENGFLIIATENKIGLKYWLGELEDHTFKKYESIENYPTSPDIITFSKKEWIQLFKTLKLKSYFFYCFPDYKFASTIINDTPEAEEISIWNWTNFPFVHPFQKRNSFLLEPFVLKTIEEAGLVKELANSFLIVSYKKEFNCPSWIVKKFTHNLRKKPFQCVTTLYKTGEVKKERLFEYPELYKVDATPLVHKCYTSKWIKGDSWLFEFYKVLKNKNLSLFYDLLNQLNQFLLKFTTGRDEKNIPQIRGDYFDCIPRNIFKTKDGLVFIDKEWVWETNIPADFILYRTIKYDILPLYRELYGNVREFSFIYKFLKKIYPSISIGRVRRWQEIENRVQEEIMVKLRNPNIIFRIKRKSKNFFKIYKKLIRLNG